jgi:hypothetical protein
MPVKGKVFPVLNEDKPTRRHIPEDVILHIHRRENLKSHIMMVLVALVME